jgi:hypothetical protein
VAKDAIEEEMREKEEKRAKERDASECRRRHHASALAPV